MVDVRTGSLLGFIVCAGACFVENPLYFAGLETSGLESATGPETTSGPGTTGPSTDTTGDPPGTTEPGTTTSTAPVCGNDIKEPGEQCDDGNLVPGDDCEPNCRQLFRPYGQEIDGSVGAVAIAVADLDGDSADDLVLGFSTCMIGQACIMTWHNSGDGVFELADTLPIAEAPTRLFVADWTGDGVPEILATHVQFVSLVRLDDPLPIELQIGGDLSAAIVADIDGDDLLDLMVPDEAGAAFHYAFADGTAFAEPITHATPYAPRRLAVADVDADGSTDLAYSIYSGTAGFAVKSKVTGFDHGPFTSLASHASAIVIGDFAAQPWPNIGYSDPVGNTLQIFNNKGGGEFEQVSYTVGTKPGMLRLLSIRLNTDDVDNILGLAPEGLQVFTYDKVDVRVVAGKLFSFAGSPIDVAAGAIGGDGRPDLAVLTTFGCYVMINQSGE